MDILFRWIPNSSRAVCVLTLSFFLILSAVHILTVWGFGFKRVVIHRKFQFNHVPVKREVQEIWE